MIITSVFHYISSQNTHYHYINPLSKVCDILIMDKERENSHLMFLWGGGDNEFKQ
jgi:hypothetical protein